ncbi:MAG: hypothetical protein WB239_08160 [Acidimicrobiia bacterium]
MTITIAVAALILTACGGGSASSGTGTGASSTEARASSTTASSSTTSTSTTSTSVVAPPTTAPPTTGAGGDQCLIGDWKLDSPSFVDSLNEAMGSGVPGEFVYDSGDYTMDITAPDLVTTQRRDWKLKITSSQGDMVMTINDTSPDEGTWMADPEAGMLSVNMSGTDTEVTMQADVNGSLVDIPTGSVNVQTPQGAMSGQGTYECSGDTLTTTNQGVQAIWERQP